MNLAQAGFPEITDQQTLIFAMSVRIWVFNAHQERWRPPKSIGKRLHKRNTPAATDLERRDPVTLFHGGIGRFESRSLRLSRPRTIASVLVKFHLKPPRQMLSKMIFDQSRHFLGIHVRDQTNRETRPS